MGSVWARYALALACGVATVLITEWLAGPLGGIYFAIPLALVALFALIVGMGPGLVVTGTASVGIWLVLLTPARLLEPPGASEALRILAFVVSGTIISTVAGAQHRARAKLAAERIVARNAAREAERVAAVAHQANEALSESEERYRALAETLRDADRRKDEFLAMLSHELRNPLAPIRNSLYILDHAGPGGEQARRAQRVIDRQVSHMTRLIDDLLDVTRISRGKIRLQRAPLELNALVRRTIEDHRPVFERAGVALEVRLADRPVWVNGDSTRLAQVIGNLLHNAVKFTGRGGHTRLSIELLPEQRQVVIRVSDTGVGIPREMLPRLFKPFSQAETSLDRSRGGLGLGLSLVKGLVELHGGGVQVSSAGRGKGAELTVCLPEEPAPEVAGRPRSAEHARAHARRVLVIEDNADAAESLKEALELGDHVVAVAQSGPEGLARAREFRPEVVLCDIGLPGMDGYEVARALRADPALYSVGLVALTGYASPEDQRRASEAGFERHLAKPPDLEVLERVLSGPWTESQPAR